MIVAMASASHQRAVRGPAQHGAHGEAGAEHADHLTASAQEYRLTVRQPEKIQSLLMVLADLERISEVVAEDRSHDLGGAGAAAQGSSGGGGGQPSLRQQALQSLPAPPVMRQKLIRHLQREARQLERGAKRMARSSRRGSAYVLTQTYARIRKIQAMIAEILQAAIDVVERLYVRLFIDHQQLV